MSYAIIIPPPVLALMVEDLPRRTFAAVQLMLEQLAELAALWEPGDPRWERYVQRDARGLRFYSDGCCVRIHLEPQLKRLVVREIGRVLVRLPAHVWSTEDNLLGSPGEH